MVQDGIFNLLVLMSCDTILDVLFSQLNLLLLELKDTLKQISHGENDLASRLIRFDTEEAMTAVG